MGQAQAAIDPPESVPKGSADDLLSQLAGEEVDRLLADADVQEPPPALANEKGAQVFGPDGGMKRAAPSTVAPAQSAAEDLIRADQATIDQILAAAEAPELPAPEAVSSEHESPTTAAERSALDEVAQDLALQARADDQCPEPIAERTPSPLLIKPLEILNAPMALLPAPVRDAIGKIAILTLFNSIAVILYVLLFRKTH